MLYICLTLYVRYLYCKDKLYESINFKNILFFKINKKLQLKILNIRKKSWKFSCFEVKRRKLWIWIIKFKNSNSMAMFLMQKFHKKKEMQGTYMYYDKFTRFFRIGKALKRDRHLVFMKKRVQFHRLPQTMTVCNELSKSRPGGSKEARGIEHGPQRGLQLSRNSHFLGGLENFF